MAPARPAVRLWSLSGVLAAVAVALWVFLVQDFGRPAAPATWGFLLAAFVLAELLQLHIEIRKQTFSISMSELPLILALFVVGPAGTLAMRLSALLVVMAWKRYPRVQVVVNVGLVALETATAAAILTNLATERLSDAFTWLAAICSVLTANLLTAFFISVIIAWTQDRLSRYQLISVTVPSLIVGSVNACLALIVLIVLRSAPQGYLLVAVLAAAVAVLFRLYAKSAQEHRTMGEVYDFAKRVEEATVQPKGAYLAIDAVREMLNAQQAAMWLQPTDTVPGQVAYADADGGDQIYDGPADPGDPLRERVLLEGGGILFEAKSAAVAERGALRLRNSAETIGVPLSAASGVIGYMEVCDRRGSRLTFSADDVRVMESLATHVSAASQNVQLLTALRHEASHDRMTGLPNRVRLTELIEESLSPENSSSSELAVFVVDLDTVRQVNETLGHDAGDELLTAVARLLVRHAPEEATVGRVGGDEFAVLLPAADLDDAERQAGVLRAAVSVPYDVAGVTVEVNATIGLVLAPSQGNSAASLLQRADVALYAGHSGGQGVTSYQPAMEQGSLRRLHLGTQLREAMLGGQIFVVFQPLIDVATSQVRSVETLARWQHPRYGAVSPDDFIPLAEQVGMIDALTTHVLGLALAQCRRWLERGIRIEVAVNLSPRTLADAGFPGSVADLLRDMSVPPELLTFEITETSVMADPATALPVLHALHGLGVKLAIDDFGTGYSSLAYLSRLPVDVVKIDKAFIDNLGTEINDASITKAIIDLAHGLGLTVVAEGVEDELTRDLLARMGCDTIQGYLVSRPLPGARLDRWLAVRTAARPAEAGDRARRVFITTQPPVIG